MDQSQQRGHALDEAVEFVLRSESLADTARNVLDTATAFYGWLVGPATLILSFGPIVDQDTNEPTGRNASTMTQMRDNQKFDVTLTAQDAKGAEVLDAAGTDDDPQWSSSDENVFTVEVAEDNPRSVSVIANQPGSATLTVTLGEIEATLAVDVVPGNIALIQLQPSEPVDQ